MIKKVAFGLILGSLMGLSIFTVHAQDVITAKEPVTGELTNEDYALFYSYEGKKDDVIVIDMKPVDTLGDLDQPAIIVRDPKGRDLVRVDGFGSTALVTLLPADGEYTIIATRSDDASGESVGEFNLSVATARELKIGDVIDSKISSDGTDYYVYRQKDDFTLNFAREGEFAPALSVNKLNDEYSPGTLDSLFTVQGSLDIDVALGPIPGNELYVIKLSEALFDFNFETIEATYTLQVGAKTDK